MKTTKKLMFFFLILSITANAQIITSNIGSKSNGVKNIQVNQGVKIPNIDKLSSSDLKKLRIPMVSITDVQRNGKVVSSWEISPMRPKYSALELVRHYGEYSLQGWTLLPRPRFEGPEFKGYDISAIQLKFRVIGGASYLIKIKLKDVSRNWYEGKTMLAAAMNNTLARYPIDARNKVVLIPFTANSSGNKTIHIGNVVFNDKLHTYTIKSIKIDKQQQYKN